MKCKLFQRSVLITTVYFLVLAIVVSLTVVNGLSYTTSNRPADKTFTVLLDAGHGGIDSGVTAKDGTKESDLNLIFVKLLEEKFLSVGANTVLTRTGGNGLYGTATDGFKRRDMYARRDIIEASNADIVVSIHMNKFSSSSRSGPQVFFQSGDLISMELADFVQDKLNAFTGNSHSCLAGDYFILQCLPNKPCIIVECGFLSNEKDTALLTSAEYQRELTEVIFNGIMLYLYQSG